MNQLVTLQFTPNKALLGLALGFLPILILLGCWQLQRAEEKQQILSFRAAQADMPPVEWRSLDQDISGLAHRRLKVTGEYDTQHYWLLENQTWQGRVGYRIIMPFYTPFGGLLVDRGWVASTGYRKQLPAELESTSSVSQPVSIHGRVASYSDHRLLQNLVESKDWPRWILEVDADQLVAEPEFDGAGIIPLVLRLETDSPSTFTVLPQSVNMPPSKHIGYAVQWFSLAVALVVLSLFAHTNLGQWIRSRRSNK